MKPYVLTIKRKLLMDTTNENHFDKQFMEINYWINLLKPFIIIIIIIIII